MIFAYIDPGAGSLALQALIAGVLGVSFFFRSAIGRGLDRIRGRRREESTAPRDND